MGLTKEHEQAMREAVEAGLHGPADLRRGPEGFQFWAGGRMWFDGTGSAELRHLMPWLNRTQEILAEIDALRERVKTLEPYARFGSKAFEFFWHDAEPGDVDASDAQEMAVQAGLLRRRAPEDIGLSCCEYCDWQPGQPVEECSCLFPALAPLKEADRG